MGIKGLWTVLTPFSEKKSLHEIRGETLAVDLSCWVCDSQNVADYYVQPKLYLRNLFFRTIYLILADINPIFALEGDAPELKRDVMAARNAIQFRGAAPRSDAAISNKRPDVGRKRFKNVLKECESLLRCMGVRCVKGRGEAEATCAQLNAQGLVDAVVSQDSDCFAYGARRVYRNFSVSSSAGGGAMQGSVDCYDADKMYQANGFGRNKMVALAMLCGCDYGLGACGSSITTAVTFIHTVSDHEIIPRLISWVSDPHKYEEMSRWASAPGRCDRCGHVGRAHLKNGCPVCATHKGCNDLGHKSKVAEVKRELSLRSRAVSCGMPFPEPKIMKEFLNTAPEEIDLESLRNPVPSLIQFVKLMKQKLDWSEKYCVEKFLPLLTRWHFQETVPRRSLKPTTIKKKRNPRGVPSYEVIWSDVAGEYDALIPDDQFNEDEDRLSPWTTIERQDLMARYYPEVVEAYEESIKKPPKEKKTRAKKKKDDENPDKPKRKYTRKAKKNIDAEVANISGSVKNIDLSSKDLNSSKGNVSVCVNKLKRKLKSNAKKQKTIDSFIANKRRRKSDKILLNSLRCSFRNLSIGEDKYSEFMKPDPFAVDSDIKKDSNKENNLLSLLDDTGDEDQEIDLSDIIDKIVSRPAEIKTAKVNNNLVKLVFKNKFSTPRKSILRKSVVEIYNNHCSTPTGSPIARKSFHFIADKSNLGNIANNSYNCQANTSYFFDKLTENPDAFEMSLNKNDAIDLDSDTTVDYSLPDVRL